MIQLYFYLLKHVPTQQMFGWYHTSKNLHIEYRFAVKSMTSPVNPPYRHNLYRGIPVPDFITAERYEEIETVHKTRDDDVYIATYQKSGTTWLQHILNELYDHPQVGSNFHTKNKI